MGKRFYAERLKKLQRHSCSSCQYFGMVTSTATDRWALCDVYDYRMPRDRKCLCTYYKHVAYVRDKIIDEEQLW